MLKWVCKLMLYIIYIIVVTRCTSRNILLQVIETNYCHLISIFFPKICFVEKNCVFFFFYKNIRYIVEKSYLYYILIDIF